MNKKQKKSAFTMIELIVVIAITIVILTISLANYRQGEKSRRVALAMDGLVGVLKTAQNYSLAGKLTNNPDPLCRTPQKYFVSIPYMGKYSLKAINKCGDTETIETYEFPAQTNVKFYGMFLNNSSISFGNSLEIGFNVPFGQVEGRISGGNFESFIDAHIGIEFQDASVSKTVIIDGVSGRVDQE